MMREAHIGGKRMFGEQLDQLAADLQQGQRSASSPESALEDVCSRLAQISPLSSAGVFRAGQRRGELEWIHVSGPTPAMMNRALDVNRDKVRLVLSAGRSIHLDTMVEEYNSSSHFIGVPAGQYNGEDVGLGASSERKLHKDEIGRLELFGWLVGLLIENSRLSKLFNRNESSDSTARLIGFIAHELRTPLTGIRGNIQLSLMANRKGQHDRIPGRLEAAISGVDSMSGMVQKLLDVSRLERGAFHMDFSHTPLRSTVDAAIDEVTAGSESDIPPVRIDSPDSTMLEHDSSALQRAIANLIKSVSIQAEPDSMIELSISEVNSAVCVQMVYQGQRLSDDDLQALDVPLSQLDASREENDYLSLDLAFTRGVVQLHGGQIEVRTVRSSPERHEIEIQFYK